MAASLSISARIRFALLYVANRRAKPIVNASGVSTRRTDAGGFSSQFALFEGAGVNEFQQL